MLRRYPNIWRPHALGGYSAVEAGSADLTRWLAPGRSLAHQGSTGVAGFYGNACCRTIDGIPVAWCDGSQPAPYGTYVDVSDNFADGDWTTITIWGYRPPGGWLMFSRGFDLVGGWSMMMHSTDTASHIYAVASGQQWGTSFNGVQPTGWVCYTGMWHHGTGMYLYCNGVYVGSTGFGGGGFRNSLTGPMLGWANGTSYGPAGYAIYAVCGTPASAAQKDELARRIYYDTSRPYSELDAVGLVDPSVSGVGSVAGIATVAGVGRLAKRSPGSVAGIATVSGVGRTAKRSPGSVAGIATVAGVGRAAIRTPGSAAGVAAVTGVGRAVVRIVGAAAGSATAAGVGVTVVRAVGTAAGGSAAASVGAAVVRSTATAAGTGSDAGVGLGLALAVGAAAGGAATAGVGLAVIRAGGTVAGSSTAAGVSLASVRSVGDAAGVGSVAGVGIGAAPIIGSAGGTATVVGTSLAGGVGSGGAAGTSTAVGVGAAAPVGIAAASGVAVVSGVGLREIRATAGAGGLAIVVGVGAQAIAATGSAAGTAVVGGAAAAAVSSVAAAGGVATVVGFGAGIETGSGAAGGGAGGSGAGVTAIPAIGGFTGTTIVVGVSAQVQVGAGIASGAASASGVSLAVRARGVTAAGTSFAVGAGARGIPSVAAGAGVAAAVGASPDLACGDFILADTGRQGIGVAQPQSGSDFPLVGPPSADIRWLLADAHFAYDDPYDYGLAAQPFTPPFRIWWLHGVGCRPSRASPYAPEPTHDADVLIVDANRCVVFDSTTATDFLSRAWGDRLHVYSWKTADAVFSLVTHTAWAETASPQLTPQHYLTNLHPKRAILDERTVLRRPKRVRSLQVAMTSIDGNAVEFVEGYNMRIAHAGASRTGLRLGQRVEFRARPGDGRGVFPGCEPPALGIRAINGVGPTAAGDFFLAATGCHHARQPSALDAGEATVTDAMLAIGNDCGPCCSCEDYVALAEYMNATRDRYAAVGRAASAVRDTYHANRDRWCAAKCCAENQPLRLTLQPQLCPFLDVAAQFVNLGTECVGPVQLTLAIELPDGSSASCDSGAATATEVPGFTYQRRAVRRGGRHSLRTERYTMGGAWPTFTATWDSVEPRQHVWVRFRLKFGCCGVNADGGPLTPQVTLTGTVDGVAIGATACDASASASVTCDTPVVTTAASVIEQAALRCPPEPGDVINYTDCIKELI